MYQREFHHIHWGRKEKKVRMYTKIRVQMSENETKENLTFGLNFHLSKSKCKAAHYK